MDDGIECWMCDLDPGSPSGAGQCRDENDKGKLQKCGVGRVCMRALHKGKEY